MLYDISVAIRDDFSVSRDERLIFLMYSLIRQLLNPPLPLPYPMTNSNESFDASERRGEAVISLMQICLFPLYELRLGENRGFSCRTQGNQLLALTLWRKEMCLRSGVRIEYQHKEIESSWDYGDESVAKRHLCKESVLTGEVRWDMKLKELKEAVGEDDNDYSSLLNV